jgi:hypothetical protein
VNDRASPISRVFTVIVVLSALAGCGGGYSTQEAYARCEEERTVKVTMTDESFAECVACYENCGSDCEAAGASPETYSCPE